MSNQQKSLFVQQKNRERNYSNFEQSAVASENDLDGILRDVEKMEASARNKNVKSKWKPSVEFTQQDEEDLDQIFEDAERRKKDMENVLSAIYKSSDNNNDEDDSSSSSSSISAESSDSELDELDRFLDEGEFEDELELKEKPESREEEEMNAEMDEILKQVDGTTRRVNEFQRP